MQFLKQSTAVDVMLGPFVDDTDGKTTEEALTLSQADLHLSKNGAASAQKNDATAATHRYGGNYMVDLDATDTNTLGHLRLMCKESGALPVIADFMVLPAEAYDTLVGGTDNFTVDLSTQAKADVNAEADTAISDAALATAANLATVDTNVDAILVDTGTTIPAQITALNDLSAADVNAEVDTALVDYDAATNADLGEAFAAYGPFHSGARNVEITEDNTSSSIKGSSFQGVENTGTYLDLKALRSEHEINSTGTGGAAVENDISIVYGADVGADSTAISVNFSGRINGSNDTCVVYAYDFDAAGWETLGDMTGTGEATNFPYSFPLYSRHTGTGADEGKVYIRFFANNQSSPSLHLDRLLITANSGAPTKAEFDAGLAALENISAADVNAQVDIALADYDGPTKAELDAGLAALNDPTAAAIADAVLDEALAGHTTAGSAGKALADIETDATAILEDTATTIPALIAALNDLSEAQVNAQVDVAIADAALATAADLATVDGIVDAILVDTGTTLPATLSALNDISVNDILTTQLAEVYPTDGTAPTVQQALIFLQQMVGSFSISGTTLSVYGLDDTTVIATFSLDDAVSPTSRTRAT